MYVFIELGRLGCKQFIQLGFATVHHKCLMLHKHHMEKMMLAHDTLAQGLGHARAEQLAIFENPPTRTHADRN